MDVIGSLDAAGGPPTFKITGSDGVATSVALCDELALAMASRRLENVGRDLVHHAANRILSLGAEPMALTCQYLAGRVEAPVVEVLVEGILSACGDLQMVMAGFSSAEASGAASLVGGAIGRRVVAPRPIEPGDRIFALEGAGLHSAGFPLARALLFGRMGLRMDDLIPSTNTTVAEALLTVRRCYLPEVRPILDRIVAFLPITSGPEATLRAVLPPGLELELALTGWKVPPLFSALAAASGRQTGDLFGALSMGIGALIVTRDATLGTPIGEVVSA